MLWPILITGAVLGGIAAFAPRATPSTPSPSPSPTPTPTPGPMPDVSSAPPTGRTIRIDPDAMGTIRARVGDTISMHGVSPQSADNPEGYDFRPYFEPGRPYPPLPFQELERRYVDPLINRVGINDYQLVAPGRFEIRWAPNHVVTVEVSP